MILTDIDSNTVFFSQILNKFSCYKSIKEVLNKHSIEHRLIKHTKDYWVRDFMPIQMSEQVFIQYKYEPDYLKNQTTYITEPSICNRSLNIETKNIDLILDGGNVIKCYDSIIMTEKVFSENSHLSKSHIIKILEETFECKIIIIPWDKADIYGHADGMVRYIEDKKILLNNYCDYSMSLRNKIVKYLQPYFDLVELHYNTKKPSINNWAYINYLQVQNLILLPKLGIVEDEQALNQFQKIFPDKQIEQVDTSELVPNGGALNCISWNIKY